MEFARRGATPAASQRRSRSSILVVLLAVVALAILVTVVIAALSGRPTTPAPVPSGSPERGVMGSGKPPSRLAAYAAAPTGLSTEAETVIALAVLEQTQLDGLTTHIDDATRTHSNLAALLAGSLSKLPLAAFTADEVETMRTRVSEGEAILTNTVTRTNEQIEAGNARIQAEAEAQRLADEQAAREAGAAAEESSSSGSVSVYYPNCTAAKAAGAAPLHVGEPWYRLALDRDKDGVACE